MPLVQYDSVVENREKELAMTIELRWVARKISEALPRVVVQALMDGRINANDDGAKARNVKRRVGAKPPGARKKAASTASSMESRLKDAARKAFHLGGED